MPADMIFLRENPIHDPAEMEAYERKRQQLTGDGKMMPPAAYGAAEAIDHALRDARPRTLARIRT